MAVRLGARAAADDLVEVHEINVTPFIDVMLVLLIIFMVAAPLPPLTLAWTCPPAPSNRSPVRTSPCSLP
jgi:biopolymer transport protein ExbD